MVIVYTYFVLDIVHKGHLEMLHNGRGVAGSDGLLVVGILTTEAVMEKKPCPILTFEERVELARNISGIDLVVAQKTYSPFSNILTIKPDILMESTSHADEPGVTALMQTLDGRIIRIPYFPDRSSTSLKEKIRE